NDKRIAKLIPNIPLIMGGHEHTNSMNKVGNVLITKADANAKTVYIHKITFDKKTKNTIVNSELKEVNSTIQPDAKIAEIVGKWQTILNAKIKDIIESPDEIIFTANTPLDGRDTPIRSTQTNLGHLITQSMSFAFDDTVDCALVNGGSIRIDDQLEGAINAVDIFRVLPYGGSILKVKIKGRLLKRVLDYSHLAAGTGAYLQRFNANKVGEKWYIKNQKLQENYIYTVAFSDYLLKGFDIPFLSKKNKEVISIAKTNSTAISSDIRKAVILFLKQKKERLK
ncbi:MAG: bifunctional metallophosphatase/5'-nucleotidase, partial [Polaribacter sp.]|uniref:bifunctional metallophosphatase/5'-nucleotidase n=1 Tax=Polaribacter sp. TaxID=1920175 RepID=UPI003219D75E